MKKLVARMLCLCLLFIVVVAIVHSTASISGDGIESFDVALEFEYRKNDVEPSTDCVWSFAEDKTIFNFTLMRRKPMISGFY